MFQIDYSHQFNYRYSEFSTSERFPLLLVKVVNPSQGELSVDIDAELDSGAQQSLFNGTMTGALGITLLSGAPKNFEATNGSVLETRIHQVKLICPQSGHEFILDVAFSLGPIKRNLLGRDFFNGMQLGFHEYANTFYVRF